jgi:hypothetical protein
MLSGRSEVLTMQSRLLNTESGGRHDYPLSLERLNTGVNMHD